MSPSSTPDSWVTLCKKERKKRKEKRREKEKKNLCFMFLIPIVKRGLIPHKVCMVATYNNTYTKACCVNHKALHMYLLLLPCYNLFNFTQNHWAAISKQCARCHLQVEASPLWFLSLCRLWGHRHDWQLCHTDGLYHPKAICEGDLWFS